MMPSPLAIDFQPLCAFLATQDEVVAAYLFGSWRKAGPIPAHAHSLPFPTISV